MSDKLIKTRHHNCTVCDADDYKIIGSGPDFEYETCANEFTFACCNQCGHLYLNPLPDPSELDTIYPENYGNFESGRDQAITFKVKNWLDRRYLQKMTEGLTVNRALDVGCADGRMLQLCREVFPNAQDLEGIEFSKKSSRLAVDKGFKVHIGSIDELDLQQNYYDLIFLQQVIEHVYDPVAVVHKLHGSLQPGGRVCFEMPTSEAIDRAFGEKRYWGGYHFPRHFNFFSEKSFSNICQEAGFNIVSVAYRYQPVHWVWTVHHWLKEKGCPTWLYNLFHIKNPILIAAGTVLEACVKLISGKAANMQIIVEKKS